MKNIGFFIKQERIAQNMDQMALADGICSNSYLSKIENNSSSGHEELIILLCDRLGYPFSNLLDKEFEMFRDWIWNSFIYDKTITQTEMIRLENYLESYKFSRYTTDIYLLNTLHSLLKEMPLSIYDNLSLTSSQSAYFDILKIHDDISKDATLVQYQSLHDEIGKVSLYIASHYFALGQYYDAIQYAIKSFKIYAANGNLSGMIDASFVESNAYSNINEIEKHELISRRILKLNEHFNRDDVYYHVYYNLGATYTVLGQFSQAKVTLEKCFQYISDQYDEEYIYFHEKLLIIAIFEKDKDTFNRYISKVSKNAIIYNLLIAVVQTNFDFKSKAITPLLESAYHNELSNHHGRQLLYGSLLYQNYHANYQYPKALKLLDQIKSTHHMFFEI